VLEVSSIITSPPLVVEVYEESTKEKDMLPHLFSVHARVTDGESEETQKTQGH
jgi:hypothetical protein